MMRAIELDFYQGQDSLSEEFNLYELIRKINSNPVKIIINQNDDEEIEDENSVIKVEPEFLNNESLKNEFEGTVIIAQFDQYSIEPCYIFIE